MTTLGKWGRAATTHTNTEPSAILKQWPPCGTDLSSAGGGGIRGIPTWKMNGLRCISCWRFFPLTSVGPFRSQAALTVGIAVNHVHRVPRDALHMLIHPDCPDGGVLMTNYRSETACRDVCGWWDGREPSQPSQHRTYSFEHMWLPASTLNRVYGTFALPWGLWCLRHLPTEWNR